MATEATDLVPSADEVLRQKRPNPRIAQLKRTLYFLRRNTLAMVGLGVIIFIVGLAVYSVGNPMPADHFILYCGSNGTPVPNPGGGCVQICTYPSGSLSPGPGCLETYAGLSSVIPPTVSFSPPSGGPLPLGSLTTTPSGLDFFSVYQGIIKGAGWDVGISTEIVVAGALIGLALGAVSGYKGGYTDEVIMRGTDIFLSIPQLFLVIVFVLVIAISTSGTIRVQYLVLGFVITWWPTYARIVRAQVLVTREQKYVEAARASGAKTGRIVIRHIIPNSLYPVLVQMPLDIGTIPIILAGIAFLGFRLFANPYFPEWGTMTAIASSSTNVTSILQTCALFSGQTCLFPWWMIFFPGFMIFLFAISVNFFSDGLRDALDPRLRR